MSSKSLLSVTDLSVCFGHGAPVVNGVDFDVRAGEVVGLVGESGSGKSTIARSLLGLNNPATTSTTGSILFDGTELVGMGERDLSQVRGSEIAMVFQDPMTSLNPVLTIGEQLIDTITRHTGGSRRAAKVRAVELLEKVGISRPDERLAQYPFEFSGGMRQRVLIAIAVSCGPRLIIADEPTTALDVTVQAQILELLRTLVDEEGMSMLIISHDLGVIAGMVDTVCVLKDGRLLERGTVFDVFESPKHPYTQSLLAVVRKLEDGDMRSFSSQGGAR